MTVIVKAEVSFGADVEVKLNMTQEKFDSLSDETKAALIENGINKATVLKTAELLNVDVTSSEEV